MRRWGWLLLAGCAGEAPEEGPELAFPADFGWGAATAGFQVDMGCPTWSPEVCEDRASDWYAWVTDPAIVGDAGLHVSGEPVSHGPGMWETFEADVARMEADGFSAYRMSIEWSRLFPDGGAAEATTAEDLADHADPEAVVRYHAMFAALAAARIAPIVTLNHYTLPLWVHDGVACHADLDACSARGWVDGERILPQIALYAAFVASEYGAEVDEWATLNEPFATSLSGYLNPGPDRSSPPGISFDGAATVATAVNQVIGSAAMYDAVHAHDRVDADGDGQAARVGVVLNMVSIAPNDPSNLDDQRAVAHMDHIYHGLFLDALTRGAWDDDLDGTFDRNRDDLAGRLDWVGVNYYNRVVVRGLPQALLAEIPAFDFYPEFSWDPYPEGLGEVVSRAAAYGLPVRVTENGTPYVDEAERVLEEHLVSLHGAMEEGADVRSYTYWSLVDNYEWNHGFDLRFGLYELDVETKDRTARPVLERYRTIIADGGLDP